MAQHTKESLSRHVQSECEALNDNDPFAHRPCMDPVLRITTNPTLTRAFEILRRKMTLRTLNKSQRVTYRDRIIFGNQRFHKHTTRRRR